MFTSTIEQSKTELLIADMQFAHRWVLKVHPDLTEESWTEMLFEYGTTYAKTFSHCFGDKAKLVYDTLLCTPPAAGEDRNWFWQWFKLKWALDDWQYINSKAYTHTISYAHYKSYMILDEGLEVDLINVLHDKTKL